MDALVKPDHENMLNKEENEMKIEDIIIPPLEDAINSTKHGNRFFIKKIVNENFKSYGGVQTLAPFNESFTSIIGPNGSGKSNVIDSLLFVLGHRASDIRSKNSSLLIHKSKDHPNINRCTVTVHFIDMSEPAGEMRSTDVEGREVVISRTASRDNLSYYTVNGRRAQYKDVVTTLRSHGFEISNNRFCIMQGEVQQIALMKPKGEKPNERGMLEYLDSVIKTDRYKEPLIKLEERITEVNCHRQAQCDSLRVSKSKLQDLQNLRDEALLRQDVTNSIIRVKNELYQKELYENSEYLQRETTKKEICEIEIEAVCTALSDLKQIKIQRRNTLEELKRSRHVLHQELEVQQALFDDCDRHDFELQANIKLRHERRCALKETLKSEKAKLLELNKMRDDLNVENSTYDEHLEHLYRMKDSSERELQSFLSGIREISRSLADNRDTLHEEMRTILEIEDKTRAEFTTAKMKLKLCSGNMEDENNKLKTLKSSVNIIVNTLTIKTELLNSLTERLHANEEKLRTKQSELADINREEIELQRNIRSVNRQLGSCDRAATLQGRRSVLEFLLDRKGQGDLPGVLGRLGDLGTIDSKYNVAFTCSTNYLDYIVVTDEETGEKCISLLSQYNKGGGHFIVLDKQKHFWSEINAPFKSPEGAPRLFDLLKVDNPNILPALYFALGNTVVTKDLDHTMQITSEQNGMKLRTVTLQGDVRDTSDKEPSVTIAGCGDIMGEIIEQQDVNNPPDGPIDTVHFLKLEDHLNGMINRQSKLRAMAENLEDTISQVEGDVRDKKIQCKKYTIEVQSLANDRSRLDQEYNILLTSNLANQEMVKNLHDAVNISKRAYEESVLVSAKMMNNTRQSEVEVQQKLEQIKTLQKNVTAVNKDINKLQCSKYQLKGKLYTNEMDCSKFEKRIRNIEADINSTVHTLLTLNENCEQNEIKAKSIISVMDKLKAKSKQEDTEHRQIQEALNTLLERENTLKLTLVELQQNAISHEEKCKERVEVVNKLLSMLSELNIITTEEGQDKEVHLTKYSTEYLADVDKIGLQSRLTKLQTNPYNQYPDLKVIKDFQALYEETALMSTKLCELRQRYKKLIEFQRHVNCARHEEFLRGLSQICSKLKEVYQSFTRGGDVALELVDCMNPYDGGVLFKVRLPQKHWKIMNTLSGGETTLCTLALLFALHRYRPSPIYVLDEIDSALDYRNVQIVADYIKNHNGFSQFIVISLRTVMAEHAHRLVGIYKHNDCTRALVMANRHPNKEEWFGLKPDIIAVQKDKGPISDRRKRSQSPKISHHRSVQSKDGSEPAEKKQKFLN